MGVLKDKKIALLEELVKFKQGYIDLLIGDYEDEEMFAYKTMHIAQNETRIESEIAALNKQIGTPTEVTTIKGGWECPRCGQINAIWKSVCDCPPRTITSNTVYNDKTKAEN